MEVLDGARTAAEAYLPASAAQLLATVDGALGLPGASAALLAALLLLLALRAATSALGLAGGGRRRRRDAVLLVGETGSGKTTLLHRIVAGVRPETVTSMQPAERVKCRVALLGGDGGSDADPKTPREAGDESPAVTLVDFPGHKRLRDGLRRFLPRSKALIFVVDSGSMDATLIKAAEFLYALMTDEAVATEDERDAPPVLLACNPKGGRQRAPLDVKKTLAKHIDTLRRAAHGALGSTEEEVAASVLGRDGEPFDFDVDAPCEVTFAEVNVNAEGDKSLAAVKDFLEQAVGAA